MKKMTLTMKSIAIALAGVVLLSINACQSGPKKEKTAKEKEISILYPNWEEGIAFTHLAEAALLDKGYNVKITPLEPGPIYASLAKGDADIMMDAWLPNTHRNYWEKFGDNLEKIGESFSSGTTGLVVPNYVKLNSIEDLKANVDMFDGEIIGIGSGAGIHGNTEKTIEAYELDFKQVTSSGPAMQAALKRATAKEKPIIITGWKPHFMWSEFDIKYLDDPKGIFPKDVCAIVTRKNFKKERPIIGEFFSNFNLSEDQLLSLMTYIRKGDDTAAAAKKWYNENKATVEAWMPEKMKK
ncbi:MAG: glycine betaine ABC transporter substrate-binding protein [Salinivirgaceae bacterium]|jgi:glycine betaine/proline transport system substrate-binding protein|nr:glycine betaine ABC transporter substrate-binding protein [Salinivirgaceae bacterium]